MGLLEMAENSELATSLRNRFHADFEDELNSSQANGTTISSTRFRVPVWGILVLVAAYAPVLISGFAGNSLVIAAVRRFSQMKTITNIFICNLAVADLLVLLFCLIPNFLNNIFVPWVLGHTLCKIVPFFQGVSVCASVYSLVAISIERLLLTQCPSTSRISNKTAYIVVIGIWIWSCILSLPLAFFFQISSHNKEYPGLEFCIEIWPDEYRKWRFYYFFFVNLSLYFFIPFAIICGCHRVIMKRLKQFPIPSLPSPRPDPENAKTGSRKERKAVQRMCKVVSLIFCFTWLPLYLIVLINQFVLDEEKTFWKGVFYILYPIVQFLCTLGSAANPLVYGYLNKKFRHAFGMICKCSITLPRRRRRRRRRPDNCMLRWLTLRRGEPSTFPGSMV